MSAGHLESLLGLLKSNDPKLQCHLAGVVANCAQRDDLRAAIAAIGAVRPLISLAQAKTPEVRRVAAAVLALLSANEKVRDDLSKRGAMQLFAGMMKQNDDPVLQRSALCGLSDCLPKFTFSWWCKQLLLILLDIHVFGCRGVPWHLVFHEAPGGGRAGG